MAGQLADSGATLVVTVGALLPVALEAAGERPVWTCDRVEGQPCVQDLLASTGPVPDVAVDAAEDVAVLPYSSGTTSLPKGVMLTHANIGVNLRQVAALRPMTPEDRIIAVLPFFHIYGMTALMNLPLQAGATVVVLPRFDLAQFLDGPRAAAHHQGVRRAACRPRVGQASRRRGPGPLGRRLGGVGGRTAGRRARRAAAARLGVPIVQGLRDDRALPRHPSGPDRAIRN